MTNNDYIEIIKNQAATPTEIKPVTKILNNDVKNSSLFHVNQFGKTFIYKISDHETSFRNLMLAQALLQNDVHVPDSKVFISGGEYLETYEMIPGTTLSGAIFHNSLTNDKIEQILRDTLIFDKKITEITPKITRFSQQLILHERRKNHNAQEFGKLLAKLHYTINKKQTTYGNVALHHADLNPSNILLDDNGTVTALLDLDSLALCDEYTMLSQILFYWPNTSIDMTIKTYESVFGKKINKRHLENLMLFRKTKALVATALRKARVRHR